MVPVMMTMVTVMMVVVVMMLWVGGDIDHLRARHIRSIIHRAPTELRSHWRLGHLWIPHLRLGHWHRRINTHLIHAVGAVGWRS